MNQIFKINTKMYHLLIEREINDFTVLDLRNYYQRCGFTSNNPKKDRQFLYRQLFMLEEKGLLEKNGATHSRSITYHKSSLFYGSTIQPNNSLTNTQSTSRHRRISLEDLKQQLQQYQVKFVSSLSESEEYLRVIKQCPEISHQIKNTYHQTRDNSTRYLGKINALKKIIQAYQV